MPGEPFVARRHAVDFCDGRGEIVQMRGAGQANAVLRPLTDDALISPYEEQSRKSCDLVRLIGLVSFPQFPSAAGPLRSAPIRITVLGYLQNLTLIFARAQVPSEGSCGYSKKRLEFLIFLVRSGLFFDEY